MRSPWYGPLLGRLPHCCLLTRTSPALPADVAGGKTLVVIVHPARKVQLDLEDVARIYLKKRRFWDDGQPIVALNQHRAARLGKPSLNLLSGVRARA